MENLGTKLLLACLTLNIMLQSSSCYKDELDSNYDLIEADAKEYFIADVVGIDSLEKINYQDTEFEFIKSKNCCSAKLLVRRISDSDKDAHLVDNLYLRFCREGCESEIGEIIQVRDYLIGFQKFSLGNMAFSWRGNTLFKHKDYKCSMAIQSQPDDFDTEDDYSTAQEFRVSDIQVIEGERYAIGTFSLEMQLPGKLVDGVYKAKKEYFSITNGIFKFKLDNQSNKPSKFLYNQGSLNQKYQRYHSLWSSILSKY